MTTPIKPVIMEEDLEDTEVLTPEQKEEINIALMQEYIELNLKGGDDDGGYDSAPETASP